jgi:flagellar hook assembly protein FlgD/outer membrane protein OmpA-like peptidoglycan-associated protein
MKYFVITGRRPMSFIRKTLLVALACVGVFAVSGYDPAKGAFQLPSLYSPWGMAGSPTVTGPAAPWAAAFNPSVLAGSQVYQLEGSYTGITDFGAASQGYGSAGALSFSIPVPYAVYNGSLRFLSTPAGMTSMPLGTLVSAKAGISKDLLPTLHLGSALDLTLGGNQGDFGWGLGLDLGATWFAGNLGFLKDTRFGVSLLQIGKGYSTDPSTPLTGIFGGQASSYPSAFTFGAGMRAFLVQQYYWNLDAAIDLWSPSFQDLSADLSLGLSFRDHVSLRAGWTVGLRDTIAGSGRSFLPSIGIQGNIPLKKGMKVGAKEFRDASLGMAVAAAPLYDSLFGVGGGFNLSFGLKDRTAPKIVAELPVPFRGITYISPNGDGQQDTLEIPATISDERYIAGWKLTIEDKSSGKIVKTMGDSNERVDSISGLSSLGKAFVFQKRSVTVPRSFSWDGKDEQGKKVADGPYTVSLVAWDDNGNINLDYQSCMTVVIDGSKPQSSIKAIDPLMTFSPDGDRKKDSIAFRNTGSVENGWKVEVLDAAGSVVRSYEYAGRAAPGDMNWDGTTNEGGWAPDGLYSVRLSARDEAGNTSSSEVKGIIVDTRKPVVSVAVDKTVMSPNNDGISDTVTILPSFETFENLRSWEIAVQNPEKTRIWRVKGDGENLPAASYVFNGYSPEKTPYDDGQYEAIVYFEYRNGYEETMMSQAFYMDRTPPSAAIQLADAVKVFSPDGDASRDSFRFNLESSEEDVWNLVIRDAGKNEKVVRKFTQSLPESLEWNGKDDQGRVVPDGEYEVYVFAVDRAGNSFATSSDRVRVDTRRPGVKLALDREALSPNGDGVMETLTVAPELETREGLVSWKFSIAAQGAAGAGKGIRFSGTGSEGLQDLYVFDGRDAAGTVLPEGMYRASVELAYSNGYSTGVVESGEFLLDRTKPKAQVRLDRNSFNPTGSNGQSRLGIIQSGSDEERWVARIISGGTEGTGGETVKRWLLSGELSDIVWDGVADSGLPAPDGHYRYVVSVTDRAGNSFSSREFPFELDTSRKQATLVPDVTGFSPNGDGVKEKVVFSAEAVASDRLSGWELRIASAENAAGMQGSGGESGAAVKSWKGGTSLPKSFEWTGMSDAGVAAPDGRYMATLTVSYPNGDRVETGAGPVVLDRVAPKASVRLSANLFSPNGDGVLDVVKVEQDGVVGDQWQGVLTSAKGEVVRSWRWDGVVGSFEWDGKDAVSNLVADGSYYYELKSEDAGGNRYSSGKLLVGVETERKTVRLELEQRALSPNGDGYRDELGIGVQVQAAERAKGYELTIVAQEGPVAMTAVRTWKGSGAAPSKLQWRGETDSGVPAPEGRYAASLVVEYRNGDVAEASTASFLLDRIAPKIEVSASLSIMSPNGDGRSDSVEIRQSSVPGDDWEGVIRAADGKLVKRYVWKDVAQSFVWDGRDETGALVRDGQYRYEVESTDGAGNRTAAGPLVVTVETEKKTVSLYADVTGFSPNGDGVKEKVVFSAEAVASDRLSGWELRIASAENAAGMQGSGGESGAAVKSWKGGTSLPKSFEWTGMSDAGVAAPDGRYMATLTVSYPNGDRVETGAGPVVLDRVAPKASVRLSANLFSPNGDGVLDVVKVEQDGVVGDQWQGVLTSAKGEVVRSWRWDGVVGSFEWDGKDAVSNLVADGSYYYELKSEDAGGNRYSSGKLLVGVETERKTVRLELEQRALSPNGDGYRDELGIGVQVQAAERAKGYELTIVAQEGPVAMTAVRTWKGSGAAPSKLQWRGETDSGVPAPEGRYAASLVVEYRNGDVAEASTASFLLDRIAPKIEVSASLSIMSPNGDGRSDSVEIRQSSVPGDDWEGVIRAADGKLVKRYVWKDVAQSFVWDGRDETGALVRDGQYRYEVESTDGAGNRTAAGPLVVTVETEKHFVKLGADTLAFSPNGDGKKESIRLETQVQQPERVKSWELVVVRDLPQGSVEESQVQQGGQESGAQPVRKWSGTQMPGSLFYWDGVSDSGLPAPDGAYRARLTVLYRNDDLQRSETGPFIVDRIAPEATLRDSAGIFSPNGDGKADTIEIDQRAQPGDTWQGYIISSAERIIRNWTWEKNLAPLVWDGKTATGSAVPDGMYYYELRSIDAADNSFTSARIPIEVDAAKKTLRFEVDQKAFSPNGDGIKDTLYVNIQATKPQTIEAFSIEIFGLDQSGRRNLSPVKSWRGTSDMKDQYAWDGKTDSGITAPDGRYQAVLNVLYRNRDAFALASEPVLVDTVGPTIAISGSPLLFSPNGDGNKDSIFITQNSSVGDDWTGRVRDASGQVIKTWTWKQEARSFAWDGKNTAGAVVRDGQYSYEVLASDSAGNAASAKIARITVDGTKPKVYVTASDVGMSPNGDGIRDEVSFTIIVERRESIESWRFSLLDRNGEEKSFFGGSGSEVPARLVWDGRDLQGQVLQGDYVGRLVVTYANGFVAEGRSAGVIVDVDPPSVKLTVEPEYFSPDGDGVGDKLVFGIEVDAAAGIKEWKLEIFETAVVESSNPNAVGSERLFKEWSGKDKPPERLTWDGKSPQGELVESATDYPFTFVGRDALGNTATVSGIIAVDVLVLRDGDRLKIKVPSIVFRANYADFAGLSKDIVARNERVVARIAQILNKFPDYSIRIEGHANNVGKMLDYSQARIQSEETKELIPLSTGRAELVRSMLVQNGVDSRRLSVQGLGSSEPVVSFKDVENRWKNRRVEFVLIKNQ